MSKYVRREVTFAEGLLGILTYHSGGWRVLRGYVNGEIVPHRNARKYVIADRAVSDSVMRTTLTRLKKLGYVDSREGEWTVTKTGREYLKALARTAQRFPAHTKALAPRKDTKETDQARIIVAFDVPESKRQCRKWLRTELGLLGFELLQQSVWIGPAPLPEGFIERLHQLDILEHVKFFHVAEADVV